MEEGRRAGVANNGDSKEGAGCEHPDTLTTMGNLALIHNNKKKKRAMEGGRRAEGANCNR